MAAATASSGERAVSGWAIRSSTHWEKENVVAEVTAGRVAAVAAIARASRGRETLTIVDCVGVNFAVAVGWYIGVGLGAVDIDCADGRHDVYIYTYPPDSQPPFHPMPSMVPR